MKLLGGGVDVVREKEKVDVSDTDSCSDSSDVEIGKLKLANMRPKIISRPARPDLHLDIAGMGRSSANEPLSSSGTKFRFRFQYARLVM